MTSAPLPAPHHDDHTPDGGLALDLGRLIGRRRLLGLVGAAGAAALLASCGSDGDAAVASTSTDAVPGTAAPAGTASASTASTVEAAGDECAIVPSETSGPYPGDGSNGVNVLTESGVVRSDITTSIGDLTGTATGVPVTLEITVLDSSAGCAPLRGGAVYLWHADSVGRYSLYSSGATDQNYLRGVQAADADGIVRFTTIWPGCYDGRWPHMHFEVYPDIDRALATSGLIATSQLALPEDVCNEVYATAGYEASAGNLAGTSLERDMVFRDDLGARQTPTVTGDVATGYTASITITV